MLFSIPEAPVTANRRPAWRSATSEPCVLEAFWQQRDVQGREGGERTFNHPADGFLRYEQVTFDLASKPGMKLTVLVGLNRSLIIKNKTAYETQLPASPRRHQPVHPALRMPSRICAWSSGST